jgi:hypothetical protein
MNLHINQLVKSIFKKDSIEQCSVQELQQYAERHPYFGAAQLLLTKKMQAENHIQYNEQLQKTFLYFHNPLWVEQLLNETGNAIVNKTEIVNTQEIVAPVPSLTNEAEAQPIVEAETTAATNDLPAGAEEPVFSIAPLKIEPIDPAKTELTFEPFHTVDYFASQGIKLKEDEKPKDKFGIQLKSFTEWLKTMKRLPVADVAAGDAKAEQKVEQLAEHSLSSREVLTETMAEVWEKQGNKEKAIEIYSKLSLLEPSKIAYFAAKIEELKKSN